MSVLEIRAAREADLPAITALLANDPLGAGRESPVETDVYVDAFRAIEADANNTIVVADAGGDIVGCLQLTIIPGLTRSGMTRAQIEGIRVDSDHRGEGIGRRLIDWALERAHECGAALAQLTSDKSRENAHEFYRGLGFVASHEGFKRRL